MLCPNQVISSPGRPSSNSTPVYVAVGVIARVHWVRLDVHADRRSIGQRWRCGR